MKSFILAAAVLVLAGAQAASAAEKTGHLNSGAEVISFDTATDKTEVFNVLRALLKANGTSKTYFVVTGTHGASAGTVTSANADVSFKSEDLDSAKITSNHISIRDYHQTAANRWEELDAKGDKVVIVLAWCFSHQWLSNTTADGNHGRLKMK